MTLRLDGELNDNLLEVLTSLCIDLQKQFDISPELLNSWINSPGFQTHLEESHKLVMEKINQEGKEGKESKEGKEGKEYKDPKNQFQGVNTILGGNNLVRSAQDIEAGDSQLLNKDDERCGKLIKNHPNGFEELCNEHKYLHENLDHEFTYKTDSQLLREKQFEKEWRHINEYGRGMYERAWTYVQNYIEKHYERVRYPTGELERVRPRLQANQRLFKSRIAINQVARVNDPDSSENSKGTKYVYGPHFDLFTPL